MSESNGIVGAATLVVGIGELKVGRAPSVIRTNLGSCIAVCLYDGAAKAGGMLHVMLASSLPFQGKPGFRSTKYADTGIAELLGELERSFQAKSRSLKAKIFGGAKLLKGVSNNIGDDNEKAARDILKSFGIGVAAAKTGGQKGYQVDMDLATGIVKCRVFGESAQEF